MIRSLDIKPGERPQCWTPMRLAIHIAEATLGHVRAPTEAAPLRAVEDRRVVRTPATARRAIVRCGRGNFLEGVAVNKECDLGRWFPLLAVIITAWMLIAGVDWAIGL